MKKPWLILGILLVLAANTIALIKVSINRAGTPIQSIELTERELALQNMGQDNSGVGLLLRWTRTPIRGQETLFSREQLEAIGFDFRTPAGTAGKDVSLIPRAALIVLEYDGDSYRRWVERWNAEMPANKQEGSSRGPQTAGNFYDNEDPQSVSRLFPIDIGTDLKELRRRYPDQSRYLIVSAVIRASIEDPAPGGTNAAPRYAGFVQQVLPFYINVPLPHSRTLALLKPQTGKPPRFSVALRYGSNLEPWVTAIKRQ